MDDIRKERLMISITTLAGIACILQNSFGGWEFWVPVPVVAGMVMLWYIHIAGKLTQKARIYAYFSYAALLLFYHGIHDTSLFDISVSVALFMVTFTMADSVRLLNIILAEYTGVLLLQFYFLAKSGAPDMSAFERMRIVYHVGMVLTMYIFSRITINHRVSERENIDIWKESVKQNNHDMEDFLSNISHELRTPVNVIGGMTSILQKDVDRKELSSINDAEIRLSHQIEDIQDYTELKRGELVLEEENYMCISLINDVVSSFNNSYKEKNNLELIVDLAPETPSMLKGDIRKIRKLFRHLLDNAVKFTKYGGIYIHVFPVVREYGMNLTIEISDTGIGMSRADMAAVTKGMYQADKNRNRATGGIGIGLPIVYGFVHTMGGFVKIDSALAKGTTVRISIPQEVVDPEPCLSVKKGFCGDIVFYINQEKFKYPELREFNSRMAIDLATGLNVKLFSASDKNELEHLINDLNVTHIFTGGEEYESEYAMLEYLTEKGIKLIVSAEAGFCLKPGSKACVLPKPLYGFPIVRVINGEEVPSWIEEDHTDQLSFDGVSALIVDDEPMNLVVASGLLKEYKMVTDTAESGKEAIEKYNSGEYDIIFMDHMMPEMDGVEAMKRIRQAADETERKIIIVALTANALSGAREMFIREGFDGFIAKPIDIAEFERVMRRVLNRGELKR